MTNEEKLGSAPLFRLMMSMGIPNLVAQIINLLYNIIDRIYIGHIPEVGATALTGVGLALPMIVIISAFSAFVGAGGAPLSAIALGRGKKEEAEGILEYDHLFIWYPLCADLPGDESLYHSPGMFPDGDAVGVDRRGPEYRTGPAVYLWVWHGNPWSGACHGDLTVCQCGLGSPVSDEKRTGDGDPAEIFEDTGKDCGKDHVTWRRTLYHAGDGEFYFHRDEQRPAALWRRHVCGDADHHAERDAVCEYSCQRVYPGSPAHYEL